MSKQRIDRFLSNQLHISRNEARTGIKRGLASVNGQIVRGCGYPVEPDVDEVLYEGVRVAYKRHVYLMLNKPAGIISASRDKSRKTVLDLVPERLQRNGLSVVGRLDKDTTGLILITDDGEFAHKCISPKSNTEKSYLATLDGEINGDMIKRFADGITLANGEKCKSAVLEKHEKNVARVIITEGKYHQIKRMFGAVGLGVTGLHRERIGGLILPDNLAPGECREVPETAIKTVI
ncbi:MAG: rRNA pseudouridine synthase [Clostridia bacterium]|nr:rRNA pseudouridine synthase [Clostridia bacterium]